MKKDFTRKATVEQVTRKVSLTGKKVKTSEVNLTGRYPVIDQSANYIAGYVDDEEKLLRISGKAIVFGDHSCRLKLVNHDFVPGADGIVVLTPVEGLNAQFLLYVMEYHLLTMRNHGYARHWQHLKKATFSYPISEKVQSELVATISQKFSIIASGIESLEKAKTSSELLKQSILKQAFSGDDLTEKAT